MRYIFVCSPATEKPDKETESYIDFIGEIL